MTELEEEKLKAYVQQNQANQQQYLGDFQGYVSGLASSGWNQQYIGYGQDQAAGQIGGLLQGQNFKRNDFGPDSPRRSDPQDEYFGDFLNETGITPAGYKILVEIPLPADLQRTKSTVSALNGKTLALPENAEDRHQAAAVCGLVVQLGKQCYSSDIYPAGPWCKPGDWVVLSPYSGTHIKAAADLDKDYRFINEDTIEGTVPGPDFVERG